MGTPQTQQTIQPKRKQTDKITSFAPKRPVNNVPYNLEAFKQGGELSDKTMIGEFYYLAFAAAISLSSVIRLWTTTATCK